MKTPAGVGVQFDRRTLIRSVALTALAVAADGIGSDRTAHAATTRRRVSEPQGERFWPNNARLAISLSLMFEGGGQPISGAGGVVPDKIEGGVPELPVNGLLSLWYYEGR